MVTSQLSSSYSAHLCLPRIGARYHNNLKICYSHSNLRDGPLNQAVHGNTLQMPFWAFHKRYPNLKARANFPSVPGDEDDVNAALAILMETSEKNAKSWIHQKNVGRRNDQVKVGDLVWVKQEVMTIGLARKLQLKWVGPYKVDQVLLGGSKYILKDLRRENTYIQRAAEKLKLCISSNQYFVGDAEEVPETEPDQEMEPPVPHMLTRQRKPPRRLIEEC